MEKIIFEYDLNGDYGLESAWAEKIGDYYRLDNILFYAQEYSLGDIVEVEERDGELFVVKLIKESGHSTIRILFNDIKDVQSIREELFNLGCSSEISNLPTLIAVDIPNYIDYSPIKSFLDFGEKQERWGYQEACIAHN